ncbi:MAG: hypothetical protein Q4C75_03170 [Bergeyella zoohelcum]|nr:hypothetical protein [Bergeyella zoohelcum]
MKKIIISLLIGVSCLVSAQKKKKTNIMESTNIQEIESFLATASHSDPRKYFLKQKLITLKNAEWTKGAKDHKPMATRPIIEEVPAVNTTSTTSYPDETAEFQKLMNETGDTHKTRTVKLLNTLFDQDINSKDAILLITNNTNCNMIMRIVGDKTSYNLPIPAKGDNSIVVLKGVYELKSISCNIGYLSTKEITKSQMIILNPSTK